MDERTHRLTLTGMFYSAIEKQVVLDMHWKICSPVVLQVLRMDLLHVNYAIWGEIHEDELQGFS